MTRINLYQVVLLLASFSGCVEAEGVRSRTGGLLSVADAEDRKQNPVSLPKASPIPESPTSPPTPAPSPTLAPAPAPSSFPVGSGPASDTRQPFGGQGFGMLVDSGGHANSRFTDRHSYRFMAEHTGDVSALRIWVKTNIFTKYEKSNPADEIDGYSQTYGGRVRYEIRRNKVDSAQSAVNVPDMSDAGLLAQTDEIHRPRLWLSNTDKSTHFPRLPLLKSARLEEGRIYHLVARQLNKADGLISVNDVYSRVGGPHLSPYAPFRNALASIRYSSGSWTIRKGYFPLFDIQYADGTIKGSSTAFDPVMGTPAIVSKTAKSRLVVKVRSSRIVNSIHAAIYRRGTTNQGGSVVMKLQRSDGSSIKSVSVPISTLAHIPDGKEWDSSGAYTMKWIRFPLGSDVTLSANATYYVEFSGTDATELALIPYTKGSRYYEDDINEPDVHGQYILYDSSTGSWPSSWTNLRKKFGLTPSVDVTIPVLGILQP